MQILVSLLLDRGDSVLMEEYTYPHMLECVAAPKGLHVLPLPMDAQGIIPEAMEQVGRGSGGFSFLQRG
jgi:DNA-binding transcriptional MocR family regulator